MKLSKNFTLSELTKSDTAIRLGIDNTSPNDDQIESLVNLCEHVLQPVRDHFGKSVKVNSGFRCLDLNRVVKSSDKSSHTRGEAADIEIDGVSNYDLAKWIKDNLDFDQVILEFYTSGIPDSGWVHVSFCDNNRKQALTISKSGTVVGLVK